MPTAYARALREVTLDALSVESQRVIDYAQTFGDIGDSPFTAYQLTDGSNRVIRVDSTAAKGAFEIEFTRADGRIVSAHRVTDANEIARLLLTLRDLATINAELMRRIAAKGGN
jgi:hypothetical protein